MQTSTKHSQRPLFLIKKLLLSNTTYKPTPIRATGIPDRCDHLEERMLPHSAFPPQANKMLLELDLLASSNAPPIAVSSSPPIIHFNNKPCFLFFIAFRTGLTSF